MEKRKLTTIIISLLLLFLAIPLIAVALETPGINLDTTKTVVIDGLSYQVNKKEGKAKVIAFDGTKTSLEIQSRVETGGVSYPVREIGSSAFLNCTELTSVVIGEGVTTLGSSSFKGCSSLTDVLLPSSITTISQKTFFGCSSLRSLTVPRGVNCLKESVFENCTALESVFLFESLMTVEGDAFSGCTALQTVWYEADETTKASIFITKSGNETFLQGDWKYYYCIESENESAPYHMFDTENAMKCDLCGYEKSDDDEEEETPDVGGGSDPVEKNLPGDVNADGNVNRDDVLYLINHIESEGQYPIPDGFDCDLNRDTKVDENDATYLLYHIVFGSDLYPVD